MCGIVGVLGRFSASEGLETVSLMNQAIFHRGPDDHGAWSNDQCAIGMRRLSIIDIAGGHQPMWTEDGVGIVFNGEIYNYRALREDLQRSGYHFETHSDTEVILKLFHRDGLASIEKMEGMFAICLYDRRVNRLHLIRDRFGVKPLYFGRVGGRFYFASEIKAILAGAGQKPPLNMQALHDYLTLRFIPSRETIWAGIEKLAPGHILTLELDSEKREIQRYWELRFHTAPIEPGRDYEGEFERHFLDAVEKRLVASDVPVGVLLSGGLDSSAVSAAAVELGHRAFHTFSVAFEDGGKFDETSYARLAAEHLGSKHHEVRIGQREFIDFLPEMVRFTDEPLADLACVPLHYVCQLARKDVKVVLSGEGADELLAGYDMEQLVATMGRLEAIEQTVPKFLVQAMGRMLKGSRYGRVLCGIAEHGTSGLLAAQAQHITRHFSETEKSRLWRDFLPGNTDTLIRSWYGEVSSTHPLDQLQQVYCREWLVEDLLMKADKMSMANSIELREPFLDHRLAEWAATLPIEWKVGDRVHGFKSKRILRAFASRRLPAGIIDRPKQGFPIPAYAWLQGELGGWMESLLLGSDSRLRQYFETKPLARLVSLARSGDGVSAHKLWVMAILELWLREWA